jgi:hypothetical protein
MKRGWQRVEGGWRADGRYRRGREEIPVTSYPSDIFIVVTKLTQQDVRSHQTEILGEVDSEWYKIGIVCNEGKEG